MVKHFIWIVVLSIVGIIFIEHVAKISFGINAAYLYISDGLGMAFKGKPLHKYVPQVLALLIVPIVTGLVPAVIYYLFIQRIMPYTLQIVWGMWLVVLALVTVHS